MTEFTYYPKNMTFEQLPQFLGVKIKNNYYRLKIETFHLNEILITSSENLALWNTQHSHSVFHIVFYVEGNNFFIYNHRQIPCREGTVVLSSPEEPHCFTPSRVGKVRYHEITFSIRNAEDKPGKISFSELLRNYFTLDIPILDFTFSLNREEINILEKKYVELKDIFSEFGTTRIYQAYITLANIFEILVSVAYQKTHLHEPKEYIHPGVIAARNYIDRNFIQSPSLNLIAKNAGMSPEYLCREFKRSLGCTPITYRDKQKIEAAKRMLCYTGATIKETALRLNFKNVHYFSKVFKKITGIPPGKYRVSQNT